MTAADLVIASGILVHYDVRPYIFTVHACFHALMTDSQARRMVLLSDYCAVIQKSPHLLTDLPTFLTYSDRTVGSYWQTLVHMSPMMDEERMRAMGDSAWIVVSALTSVHCLDADGWVTGRTSGP